MGFPGNSPIRPQLYHPSVLSDDCLGVHAVIAATIIHVVGRFGASGGVAVEHVVHVPASGSNHARGVRRHVPGRADGELDDRRIAAQVSMGRHPPDLAQSLSLNDEELHFVRVEPLEIAAQVVSHVDGVGACGGHRPGQARPGGIGRIGLAVARAIQVVSVVVGNISVVDVPAHPAFVEERSRSSARHRPPGER